MRVIPVTKAIRATKVTVRTRLADIDRGAFASATVEEPHILVHFAHDVFSIDAIKRAAYRLSDRVVIDIAAHGAGITCTLRANNGTGNITLADAERDFRTEVLDQDLRAKIAKETEPLRNLILSLAFSKTGLQG